MGLLVAAIDLCQEGIGACVLFSHTAISLPVTIEARSDSSHDTQSATFCGDASCDHKQAITRHASRITYGKHITHHASIPTTENHDLFIEHHPRSSSLHSLAAVESATYKFHHFEYKIPRFESKTHHFYSLLFIFYSCFTHCLHMSYSLLLIYLLMFTHSIVASFPGSHAAAT